MVGDGLADRAEPQSGEPAPAPVADDQHGGAFGGAIFVRDGATLNIADGSFSGSGVTAGTGVNNGAAAGTDLFLQSGSTTVFNPTGTFTIASSIADDSAASLPSGGSYTAGSGAGAAIEIASGTVTLTGENTYTGGTTISGGTLAIGSGGNFALSAARALLDYEDDAETIARKAMKIAAEICVYSNENLTVEVLEN